MYLKSGVKNKTNHAISSNSHPSATANKAIHWLKIGGGGYKTNGYIMAYYKMTYTIIIRQNRICKSKWSRMVIQSTHVIYAIST